MNDQRWTLQRKKIGLKRKTMGATERNVRNKQTKDLTLNFVKNTFTRKECTKYIVDSHRSRLVGYEVCLCGLIRFKHGPFQPNFGYLHEQKVNQLQKRGSESDPKKGENSFGNGFINDVLQTSRCNILAPMLPSTSEETTKKQLRPPVLTEEEEDEEDEEENKHDENEEKKGEVNDVGAILDNEEINQMTRNLMNADGIRKRGHGIGKSKFVLDDSSSSFKPLYFLNEKNEDKNDSIKEFPTNAYGSIEFINEALGSSKPAKYVRISDTSKLESVATLLSDYWRLLEPNRPSLVISVIGGAKNFRLDGKKKETFNTGLLRAVKSTNAWILTGGMNVGVTKSVGEAVNEGQFIVKVKRKSFFSEEQERLVRGIKCIGIAPWGYVRGHNRLINSDSNDFPLVRYKVDEKIARYEKISLNSYHTHFLLIDDGIRNRFSGADKFRTELQKFVQEPEPIGLGIPAVLLILEGGISSVVECSMALRNNIPVVVVANTGRAADLLAYGVSKTVQTSSGKYVFRKDHKKQLLARIAATMIELEPKQCKFCATTILNCCSKVNLITIFDINSNEGMDKYILHALLKGGSQSSESTKIDQLNLSLLWNRPDIAETHIFPSYPVWPSGSLEDLMTIALLEEKIEFVKLLALNGLIMTEYLTVQRLREIYNESHSFKAYSANSHLMKLLEICSKSNNCCLIHVHLLIQSLARKHHDPIYMADTISKCSEDPSINYLTFMDPYQELLLWAILSNRGKLAQYLWERCNFPLVSAIAATCIYRSLWDSLGAKNTELRDEYTRRKETFEKLAVEYLDKCYKVDSNDAMGILERRHGKWGDMDSLEIAHAANDLIFLSTPCCQASIDITWRRGMMRASTMSVCVTNVLPMLVWTRLFRFQKLGDNGGELTAFQKLIVFYKSPISKFYSHSLFFVLFLALYAYVVLFDFRPEMSASEKLLLFWIFSFFVEEIRELLNEDASRFGAKLHDWMSSVWNRFDMISFFLALIAFGLRLHHSTFKWGRIAYAINTNIFYIRLFRIYHVSYKLGPKLVIFYRMISEVFVFMSLLLIFILGYGIASQALLHPWRTLQSTSFTTILYEVILVPYWQMYGELQLEKIEGADNRQCPLSSKWGVEVCENPKEYTWVVSLMLVFYLIIGNIMLLNLLIAIFTYVFDEVQENSMEIWKFEMYSLIREYDRKPGLVPPFAILEHIYRIMKIIWKKYCRRQRENLDDYMQETLKSLQIFERKTMTSYLTEVKERKEASMESIVRKMGEKIDKISKYIDQEEELREIEDLEWSKENQLEENLTNEVKTLEPNKRRQPSSNKKIFNKYTKLSSTDDDEDGEEETNKSDIDFEFCHPDNKKIYLEGFTSLPFPISRPGTGQSAVSRPITAHSRLIRSKVMIQKQQTQLDSIESTIEELQTNVEKSHRSIEQGMTSILQTLEQLQNRLDGSTNDSKNVKPSSKMISRKEKFFDNKN